MELTDELKRFIREHAQDDLPALLLKGKNYPGIDLPLAVEQIRARRQIRTKLPSWAANGDLIFPSRLAAEQCSSETTARYKQELIASGIRLCDLTGGLGIDTYYFSRKAAAVTYVERFPEYCEAARRNFRVLGAGNIRVWEGDARDAIAGLPAPDVFYLDPARRGEGEKRVFALADCEPDLTLLKGELLQRAPVVIAKISPMADLRLTWSLLPETAEIHVLSVKNECKEVLFVLRRERPAGDPPVYCVNWPGHPAGMAGPEGGRRPDDWPDRVSPASAATGCLPDSGPDRQFFTFTFEQERHAACLPAEAPGRYLYEPNASILKAGAFKRIAEATGTKQLHPSSHLYTSDCPVSGFPGRSFVIRQVIPFSGKVCKTLSRTLPRAHISVRNFPLPADELRRRTRLADGGDVYLFATTLRDGGKVLLDCRKVTSAPV